MVITRIPPSPTGHLHIGTARTALFNYLYSAQHNGRCILRSEDSDRTRSDAAYETEIIEGLRWLGIEWDNTEIPRQSARTGIYRAHLEQLIAQGHAYVSKEPSKQNPSHIVEPVRLRNPNCTITFHDLIRGEITFDTTELGDFVIARSIDDPLYHLTVVVDDWEQSVTHVIRGEDHISNTPRQIVLQRALGAPQPAYAHLPLILGKDKTKLSKRHGAVSLDAYRARGYLPEAMTNYLALLGWNPGTTQEVFTMTELITHFSLEQVQKGGAVFDEEKLCWLNKQHLQQQSEEFLHTYVTAGIPEAVKAQPQYSDARLARLLPTIVERIATQTDVTDAFKAGEYDFAFAKNPPPATLLQWKNDESPCAALPRLEQVRTILLNTDFASPAHIKEALWPYAETAGKGEVLWPLRVALTGQTHSPDPFTVAYVLGPEETSERIDEACAILKNDAEAR